MSTLVLVVCMTCIVYSCNSEDGFFDETGICEGEVHTRALSARSVCTLVDSVMEDFTKKTGIERNIEQIAKTKIKLVMNEQFIRLTEEERMRLLII